MAQPPIEDTKSNDLKILMGEDEEPAKAPKDEETSEPEEEAESDDDIILDDDVDDTKEEEQDDEEEDEEKESKEDEEDEEPDEKIGTGYGKPTYRQLVAKYPKIFKDFPGLRNTFFRERDYSKLFPTVEDARESYEQLNRLKAGEQRISAADPGDFIDLLGEYDVTKQRRFINDFLPALLQKSKPAFQAVTEPVIKHMIRSAYNDAKRNGNNNLMNSALNVHEWMFGDDQVDAPPKSNLAPRQNEPDPEKERLYRENQEILRGQHQNFVDTILTDSSKSITNIVQKNLPEDVSPFLGRSITRDVMDELANVLRDDPAHRSNMERLLKQAAQNRYSSEWKDRVKSAYLSRAKLALPTIIKKVRSAALKGSNGKARPSTFKRATGSDSKVSSRGTVQSKDAANAVKTGKMKEIDFLNG
jgi:hypothetical protein